MSKPTLVLLLSLEQKDRLIKEMLSPLFLLFIGILSQGSGNTPDLYLQLANESTAVRKEKERLGASIMSVTATVVTGNYKRPSTSSHQQRDNRFHLQISHVLTIPRPCLR